MKRERIYDVIGIDKETDKVVEDECGIRATTKEEAVPIAFAHSKIQKDSKLDKNAKLDENKIKFTVIYRYTLDNFKEDIEAALKENNETWDDVIQINTSKEVITDMEKAKKYFDFNYEHYDSSGKGVLIWTKNHVYFDAVCQNTSIVSEMKKATTLKERLTIIARFLDGISDDDY